MRNYYTCTFCGGRTVTVDLAEGVTPFTITCRATPSCKGWANSAWYPQPFPTGLPAPAIEFYKGTPADLRGADVLTRQHVRGGGLLMRDVRKEA